MVTGDTVFSEADGTIDCCVEILNLPSGGLGCDIEVELMTMETGASDSASTCGTM